MKKKHNVYTVTRENGEIGILNREGWLYIKELESKIEKLTDEKRKLEWELDAIKPVIETKQLKPAVSSTCKTCRFCVKSRWNGDIIGCCKDVVCNDFRPEESDV